MKIAVFIALCLSSISAYAIAPAPINGEFGASTLSMMLILGTIAGVRYIRSKK